MECNCCFKKPIDLLKKLPFTGSMVLRGMALPFQEGEYPFEKSNTKLMGRLCSPYTQVGGPSPPQIGRVLLPCTRSFKIRGSSPIFIPALLACKDTFGAAEGRGAGDLLRPPDFSWPGSQLQGTDVRLGLKAVHATDSSQIYVTFI